MISLPRKLAIQLLNKKSDITGSATMYKSAERYLALMAATASIRRKIVWHVHCDLLPIQIVPIHVTQFVPLLSFEATLFEKAHHLPCNPSSEKWYLGLNRLDVNSVLGHKCGILGVMVKTSTIPHVDAGLGCFAVQGLQKGETVEHYYRTLIYNDMGSARGQGSVHGERIMSVTAQEFCTWAPQLKSKVCTSNGRKFAVWIVPATFAAVRYVIDTRVFLVRIRRVVIHQRGGFRTTCLLRTVVYPAGLSSHLTMLCP